MNKRSVHQIISVLGSEAIEMALDVSSHSVRAAKTKGEFPSSWYRELKALCDEIGIPCPMNAFYWRGRQEKDEAGLRTAISFPAGNLQPDCEPAR